MDIDLTSFNEDLKRKATFRFSFCQEIVGVRQGLEHKESVIGYHLVHFRVIGQILP
jgi:hypothetical protein